MTRNLNLFFCVFVALSSALFSRAKNVPDDVELVFPPDGTSISTGQVIPIGVGFDSRKNVLGVAEDVYIYVRYPNGTEKLALRVWEPCSSNSDSGVSRYNGTTIAHISVSEPGTYV
jgi:hypothetical protein